MAPGLVFHIESEFADQIARSCDKIDVKQKISKMLLQKQIAHPDIVTWTGGSRLGKNTIYVVFYAESEFEVENAVCVVHRRSCFEKTNHGKKAHVSLSWALDSRPFQKLVDRVGHDKSEFEVNKYKSQRKPFVLVTNETIKIRKHAG